MNALELADEVEMWGKDLLALNMKGGIPVIEGAKLLRQQQAEIDKLKNLLLDNQILLDKTLNAWAKEMERKK